MPLRPSAPAATAPARPLGVARATIGVAALLKAGVVGPILLGLAEPGAIRLPFPGLPPLPAAAVPGILAVWIGAAATLALGWRTRASAGLLCLTLVTVLLGDQQLYSNHLYLLATLVGLLGLADAGAAVSLDARRSGIRERVPGWPVALLKLQVTIVYGFAALAKLNLVFLSGAVMNAYLGRGAPLGFPEALRTVGVMAPLSLAAIGVECFLALAVWSRRWRPAMFVTGLAFHAAIVLGMPSTGELVVFSLAMFALYLLFLDAEPGGRTVVWDDRCGFCSTWARWIRRLDWLRLHRFVASSGGSLPHGIAREDADRALQLVEEGGDRAEGYEAVARVLERLPATFLWAPILRCPWARGPGDRAYRRFAARRSCRIREAGRRPRGGG